MYDLKDFEPSDGRVKGDELIVLAWSKKDGYYFTQFGQIHDQKVIAKKIL